MGSEIAGTIVRLPTDEAVLSHPEYKKRNYAVGSKVSAVRALFLPVRPPVFL
jgi:NADPH2:quinone reductase